MIDCYGIWRLVSFGRRWVSRLSSCFRGRRPFAGIRGRLFARTPLWRTKRCPGSPKSLVDRSRHRGYILSQNVDHGLCVLSLTLPRSSFWDYTELRDWFAGLVIDGVGDLERAADRVHVSLTQRFSAAQLQWDGGIP